MSTLGTASIAACAVAGNLAPYLYLSGNAFGTGMTTVVAQCHGVGQTARAEKYARLLIALNYAMLVVICAAMILWRGFWVSCYHLSDQAAYLARGLILTHSLAMVI